MNQTIDIDGSLKSGSGTIVRHSLSLSSILKRDLCIENIRAKREKPGLRPQHLKAVQACRQLTVGTTKGDAVGSTRILFKPGSRIKGGHYRWDIGTAGSTTMMALCLLPLGCFADAESIYTINGGLFQDFAPNAFHLKYVLLRILKCLSIDADLRMIKPGYVPTGNGTIELDVKPVTRTIKPFKMPEQGKIIDIKGIALASHLRERRVCQRMSDACNRALAQSGLHADIEIMEDESAVQKGACLFIYAITDKGCIIGSDMAGRPGRTSEYIGNAVAVRLLEDIRSGSTVDRFTADQLILYAGLAEGESEYIIPAMNDHIESGLWLISEILGVRVTLKDRHLKIEGKGIQN